MDNVLDLFDRQPAPEPSVALDRALAGLMDQRLRLEARLAELDRVRAQFSAARLEPALMAAASKLEEQIREMDRDLTRLADAIHGLRVELEARAQIAPGAFGAMAVLFVSAGGQRFAVPIDQVKQVRDPDGSAASRLDALLGLRPVATRTARVLVGEDLAVVVDEVLRQDEVRVLPLSTALGSMKIYMGAALTAGDVLVPVLNLRELTRRPA
ncbi:MAG TPA: chemotaxis protein CheW [Terriglobales bacterium]|nr:chemotaxis protein CheW [Terriglobales bacterium]